MLRVRFPLLCLTLLLVSPVASPGWLWAQDDQDEASRLREKFREAPRQYEIVGGSTGAEKFELLEQPVLSWSNPERRTPAGALFIWTLDGRPQVAMGLYPVADQSLDHEFQSLSPYPLRASRGGAIVWQPTEAGMELHPIDRATTPSKSEPARLRQMRGLARQFTARLVPPHKRSTLLRLLASPVYRYPDRPSSEILDGAVFVFAQGTDPEVLLIIEAVEEASGEAKWQYGCARMTMVPLEVSRQRVPVWQTETAWARQTLHTPYLVVKEK